MSAAIDRLNPKQPKHVAIVASRAMDNSLSNAPGLVFAKELSTWFVVNRNCEPIIRIEGKSELAWYFVCLECGTAAMRVAADSFLAVETNEAVHNVCPGARWEGHLARSNARKLIWSSISH
jgi:hypothetical protein